MKPISALMKCWYLQALSMHGIWRSFSNLRPDAMYVCDACILPAKQAYFRRANFLHSIISTGFQNFRGHFIQLCKLNHDLNFKSVTQHMTIGTLLLRHWSCCSHMMRIFVKVVDHHVFHCGRGRRLKVSQSQVKWLYNLSHVLYPPASCIHISCASTHKNHEIYR